MNKRPIFLTALAVIHIAGGLLAMIAMPVLVMFSLNLRNGVPEGSYSMISLLVISLLFIAVLAFASGIGMIKGKKWGWWLGVLYYIYGVVRNAHALITLPGLVEDFGEPPKGAEYYYFKHGIRVLIHVLILLYFFKGTVIQYFRLGEQSKIKPIIILSIIALIIWGGLALAQLI